jgi:hypothetical protein
MRALLILAPLLLTGCALFLPTGSSTTVQRMQHDGYELTCTSPDPSWFDACEAMADDIAAKHRAENDSPIVLISLTEGVHGSICHRTTTGATACQEVPIRTAAP